MLLLHTSDWHLGRGLHGADLRPTQEAFLDDLVQTVHAERVDVVLVAGDVYDRAIPPVDAVALCEQALVRIRRAGARVVLASGNHDSACRLGFGSPLIDEAGVHVRTRPAAVAEPVLVEDEFGPVAIYAVPYLEPEAARASLPPDPAGEADPDALRGHQGVLRRATDCIRDDLAGRGNLRSVVLAHAWVTGAVACESERDITVGGVANVPAELFDGFTYTALGHLHQAQALRPDLRYSGSPVAYSFSEAGARKGCWLVELDRTGLGEVRFRPAPPARPLRVLRGTLAELLSAGTYEDATDAYVAATLTDDIRPAEAMARLRVRYPHILLLRWEPADPREDGRDYQQRLRGLDDIGVAAAFLEHVRGGPPTGGERALLHAALEAARRAEGESVGHPVAVGAPEQVDELPVLTSRVA